MLVDALRDGLRADVLLTGSALLDVSVAAGLIWLSGLQTGWWISGLGRRTRR